MQAADYLRVLERIKNTSFATVSKGEHPKVRIIDIMFVEDEKIVFVAARGKDFYWEITKNKEVAITGLSRDWRMVRIEGRVQKLDRSYVDRAFEKNPSMCDIYPGNSRSILDAFCVCEGRGELFDISGIPIEREYFAFGGLQPLKKGFRITGTCTECGSCAAECPQSCISEGAPYIIEEKNCLHCGLCYEVCPAGAVKRLGDTID